MNFLNGSCIGKLGRLSWRSSCCRDIPASPSYLKSNEENKKSTYLKPLIMQRPGYHLCLCKMPINSTLWTQVRFQNYPKLHRDIKHPSFDAYRKDEFKDLKKTKWHSGDEKQGFTYVIGFFGVICGMYGLKGELIHFLSSMSAAADVLAMAAIEIDMKNIAPGMCSSYKWRGKPLFIKRRTPTEIAAEANTPMSALKDPQTPEQRTIKPEWLIVIGICTHLGCVPVPNSGDWAGGFYCPCHGSHYDNVGRARKGPAPLNLEVPPYKFLSDTTVIVG